MSSNMDSTKKKEAFVTLATNDVYCKGARVLAQSLRVHKTTRDIIVMVTPEVTKDERRGLKAVFDKVVEVDVMDSKDAAHLAMLKRPELGVTFTKLHCWTLTDYTKCVFMDADTMAVTNIDELFDYEELSAAPDSGWPDIFNSGVFVFRPSMNTYQDLIDTAERVGSFDGGDQGLLNTFFYDWRTADINKHLSFLYNMHSTSTYTYCPAFAKFGHNTKVVHFIGSVKPWHHLYDRVSGTLYQAEGSGVHEERFIREWWALYYLCEDFINPDKPGTSSAKQLTEEKIHQWMWKTNQIDFTGKDKFSNLQEKMDKYVVPDQRSGGAEAQKARESPSPKSKLSPSQSPRPSSAEDPVAEEPCSAGDPDAEEPCSAGDPVAEEPCSAGDPNAEVQEKILSSNAATGEDSEVSELFAAYQGRSDKERFELWKTGSVDFLGEDQFAKIQSRIDSFINAAPSPADSPPAIVS